MRRLLDSDLSSIRARAEDAGHILLGLDFDGTLAPIVAHPEDARLPAEAQAILHSLAQSDHVTVAVVSGRSLADLRSRVGTEVILCGNHGLEIEGGGISFVHEAAPRLERCVDQACWDLEAAFQGVRGLVVERKGYTATLHHRLAPAHLDAWIEGTLRLVMQPYLLWVSVTPALESWEIRPRVAWNKGAALKLLLERLGSPRPLLVCAGDDTTDEDMFALSPDAISIRVGAAGPTRAAYQVSSPAELLEFLHFLRSCVSAGAAVS